jgi:hypothetical protein
VDHTSLARPEGTGHCAYAKRPGFSTGRLHANRDQSRVWFFAACDPANGNPSRQKRQGVAGVAGNPVIRRIGGRLIGEYLLVTPGGLEPPAYGLGNRRSILLSYGVTERNQILARKVQHKRQTETANLPPIACYFVLPASPVPTPKLPLNAASNTAAAASSVGLNKWLFPPVSQTAQTRTTQIFFRGLPTVPTKSSPNWRGHGLPFCKLIKRVLRSNTPSGKRCSCHRNWHPDRNISAAGDSAIVSCKIAHYRKCEINAFAVCG